jgi:hypothetical protein
MMSYESCATGQELHGDWRLERPREATVLCCLRVAFAVWLKADESRPLLVCACVPCVFCLGLPPYLPAACRRRAGHHQQDPQAHAPGHQARESSPTPLGRPTLPTMLPENRRPTSGNDVNGRCWPAARRVWS